MPFALAPAVPVLVALLEAELPIEAPRRLIRAVDLQVGVARAQGPSGGEEPRDHGARMALPPLALGRDDVEEARAIVLDDREARGHDAARALDRDGAQRERHALQPREVRAAVLRRGAAKLTHGVDPGAQVHGLRDRPFLRRVA